MADIQSNIRVNIDTAEALASIKALQRQISTFQKEMASSSTANALAAKNLQKSLIDDINATGKFSASLKTISSTTDTFTKALEKNKLSLGQYFKYGMASSKSFSRMFQNEFDTVNKVARERVKDLQTQYISLGRDASGALKSIAVRPLALDMEDLGTKAQIAAQRTQIFNQILKQGSTNLLNFGKNTQWAGRQLMVGFTIPLSFFGTAAAQEFKKVEEASIKFRRVYGDAFTPVEQTNAMLDQIKELGIELTKYGISLDQTLGLAADAAAMGNTGQKLIAQVEQSTKLAVLGQTATQDALATTISLTDAFGYSTKQLADKTNFLNAVENQTVLSIEDLTTAIPKAGPVVKQLGGDVEDLSFFMTAMKEGGINASEGANALKSGLASLINPTEKARMMLLGMGIDMRKILDTNQGNVSGVVVDFAKALDQLDPTTRAQAIEQLFGKFQFSRLSTLFQNVIAEGTQAQRVLELSSMTASDLAALSAKELATVEESPLYKFQAALEKFQAAMAPVGEQFMKMVTPFIEFGTKILNMFNGMTDGAKGFITTIVGLAGVVAPVFIMAFGLIANALANGMKGFLFLKNALQGTLKETNDLGEQTQYMTSEQLQAAAVASSLDQVHGKLVQTFTSEAGAIDKLRTAMERAALAQAKFGGVSVARGAKPKNFADGGMVVSGPGGPKGDKIPANLSDGEVVLSAETVQENPNIVAALLAGGKVKIPGFKKGGGPGSPKGSISFGDSSMDINASQTAIDRIQTILDGITDDFIKVDQKGDVIEKLFASLATMSEEGKVSLKKFFQAFAVAAEDVSGQNVSNQVNKFYAENLGVKGKPMKYSATGVGTIQQQADKAGRADELQRARMRLAAEESLGLPGGQYQIDRAHRLPVGGAAKSLPEAWDMKGVNPQTHTENQISNYLAGEQKVKAFYDKYMAQLEKMRTEGKVSEDQYLSIKNKINSNLALSEVELATQADVLEAITAEDKKTWESSKAMQNAYNDSKRAVAGARVSGGLSTNPNVGVASSAEATSFAAGIDAAKDKVRAAGTRTVQNFADGVNAESESASPSKKTRRAAKNLVDGVVEAINEGKDDVKAAAANNQTAKAEASRQQLYGGQMPTSQDKSMRRNRERKSTVGAALEKQQQRNVAAFNQSVQKTSDSFAKFNSKMMAFSSVLGSVSLIAGMFGNDLGGLGAAITGVSSVMFTLSMMSNMLINAERLQLAIKAASYVAQQAFNTGLGRSVAVARMFVLGLLGTNVAQTAATASTTGLAVGAGAAALSLWSLIWPIAAVVAAIAALGFGIKALFDWFGDQKAQITGLGDTAAMAAEKVAALGEALGVTVTDIDLSNRVGVESGTTADQQTMQQKVEASTYGSEGKSFTEYFGDNITAVKNATKGDATAALESLALQLGNSGFGPETVDGIIRAIASAAERKDLDLSFASVNLGLETPEGMAQLDKQVASAAKTLNDIAGKQGTQLTNLVSGGAAYSGYAANTLNTEETKSVEVAGGQIGTSLKALSNSFEMGTIDAATLVDKISQVGASFASMTDEAKIIALPQIAEAMGMTEAIEGVNNINDQFLILQATAAGVTITDDQLEVLKKGKAAGTKYTKVLQTITGAINTAAVATENQNKAQEALNVSLAVQEQADNVQKNIDTYNSLLQLEGVTLTTAEAIRYASNAAIQDAMAKVEAAKGTDQYSTALNNLKGALNNLVTADRQWEKINSKGGSGQKSAYQQAIEALRNQRKEIQQTVRAYGLMTKANISAGAAWKYANDATIAAGLATAKTAKQIKAITDAIKLLERENLKNAFGNFTKENAAAKETLNSQLKMASALGAVGASAEEVDALLSDENLSAGFKAGTVSAKQLEDALARIRANKEIEIKIKMQTAEGMQELFDDAYSMVQESFDAQETQIDLDFRFGTNLSGKNKDLINTDKIDETIENAQNQIADLAYQVDDYEAGIQQIQWQEDEINKKYEERSKALDRIQKANDAITRQNKAQLTIADALSQGDIAAAAKAIEDGRAQQAEAAMTSQREALDLAKQQELGALTDAQGRTRAQLETSILDLKKQIFKIEEDTLEPATEARRQADLKKQAAIDSIKVLGLNKDEWEKIKNKVDMARVNSDKYEKAIGAALKTVEDLVKKWGELDGKVVTTTHVINTVTNGSANTSGTGGSGNGNNGSGDGKKVNPAYTAAQKAVTAAESALSAHQGKISSAQSSIASLKTALRNATSQGVRERLTGDISAKEKALSILQSDLHLYQSAVTSAKTKLRGIPQYLSRGGFAKGTDTVPAMLTPGEFVMSKSAVSKYGVGTMRAMNNGSFVPKMSAPTIQSPSGSSFAPSVVGDSTSATNNNSSVYNYNLSVNVGSSNAGAQDIANAVMQKIKSVDSQRVRGVRL